MTRAGDCEEPSGAGLAGAPTLAAIILNHNYAAYLGDAIASALDQTRAFDEVIVVDDGSTDASLDVVARFRSRVRVVAKPNGGQLSAAVAGLAASRADYLCFLDADDLLKPSAVARVVPRLVSRPAKLQFQLDGADRERRPTGSLFPAFPPGYDAASMRRHNRELGFYVSPPTSGNVFARAFLAQLDLAALDGRDFIDGVPNLLVPYWGEVVSVHEALGLYRVHGRNHSRWGRPTPAVLREEIGTLRRRWAEAGRLLGGRAVVPDLAAGLFVRERELMIAALEDRPVVAPAARFVQAALAASLPWPTRAATLAWAVALSCASRRLRRRLVDARRSPEARPAILNRLTVAVRRRSGARRRGSSAVADAPPQPKIIDLS